jgi:hypothetical protein
MRKFRYGFLAVAVAMVATAMTASAAWGAHPTILIGGAAAVNAEVIGSGGKSTLATVSGKTVSCTSVTSTGKLEASETLGKVTYTFQGCAAAGVKCTSLSDTVAGEVTVTGEFHLVYDNEASLGAAFATLIEPPVHFSCSAKLLTIKGCDLALVKPINTVVAIGGSYEVIQKQASGKNEDTKYTYNTGEAAKNCVLLSSENGGSFEEAGEAVEGGSAKIDSGGIAVASELMA